MKRFSSVLLSATIICLMIFAVCGNSVFAEECENLQSFINDTKELLAYAPETTLSTASAGEDGTDFSTCRLIVKSDRKPDELNSIGMASGFKDYYIIQFDNTEDTESAFEFYSGADYIETVSPDIYYDALEEESSGEAYELTEVPDRLNSWGAETTGVYALKDYIVNSNISLEPVTVAVIDCGVELTHEFLQGRLERTYFNTVEGEDSTDEFDYTHGHGTEVSSVIVDSTPDNVKIRNYKISNNGKMLETAAVAAILQAVLDGVKFINCSFGFIIGTQKYNAGYEMVMDAVQQAYDSNVLIVCSAGNYANTLLEPERTSPASSDYALTVAASNTKARPTGWTSRGKKVNVAAPGEDIPVASLNNSYDSTGGTSFSTPLTLSLCAMLYTLHPEYSPDDLIKTVMKTATEYDTFIKVKLYGTGIIDAIEAAGLDRPTLNVNLDAGKYESEINITLSASDNSPVYYTLDNSIPTMTNGTLYTEPITIYGDNCLLRAVAFSDSGIQSRMLCNLYRSCILADESDFEISSKGVITAYSGTLKDIIIPPEIDGVTVIDIHKNAFMTSDVSGVKLPDTITHLSQYIDRWNESFSRNEKLMFIEGDNVREIGVGAFFYAKSLSEVNFPNAERAYEEAFSGISSLGELKLPKLTYAGDMAFRGTSASYLYLPELETCSYLTFDSLYVYRAYFPKLKTVEDDIEAGNAYIFANTLLRTPIDLPEIESLRGRAFDFDMGKNIMFRMEFSKLKALDDLPKNSSTLVIPSTVTRMPTDLSKCNPSTITIYGSAGTYIEQYAISNGFDFVEVTPETAVITDLPRYYDSDIMDGLEADVVGFYRTYQWYANTVCSNEGGTPIEGATDKTFNPEDFDAPYYYCVVKSRDGDIDEIEIKTSVSENINYKEIIPHDGSGVIIDYQKKYIFGLDDGLTALDGYVDAAYGCTVSFERIATGETLVSSSGNEYTLIVLGDLNGDGFADGQDAVILSCVLNGMLPESDLNNLAGDFDRDCQLLQNDYELIFSSGLLL